MDISINSYNNAIETLNSRAGYYLNTTYASDARCVGSVPNNKNAEQGNFTSEYDYMSPYTLKDADTNYETDYNQMMALKIVSSNNDNEYWLASREIIVDQNNGSIHLRYENSSNTSSDGLLCSFTNGGRAYGVSHSKGLRPVFTLKPGIKVAEGDGDEPYTLLAP